mgnify:CR=1 FL=1
MKKLLFIIALMSSLACSAQIDLYNNCPNITWGETVSDVRKLFPYSTPGETEQPDKDIYSALNIENVTFCGVALEGRAVFDKKGHTLVRLVFNPKIDNESIEEMNMTFGYFRGLLFAKLGAPKILDPYEKNIIYSGKYEWKKDNTYISVDIFSGSSYSYVTLDIDSQDGESMVLKYKNSKDAQNDF